VPAPLDGEVHPPEVVNDDEDDVSSDRRGPGRFGILRVNAIRPRACESESERGENQSVRASNAGCEIDGAHESEVLPPEWRWNEDPAARRDPARGGDDAVRVTTSGTAWKAAARAKWGAVASTRHHPPPVDAVSFALSK